jgi:hypothetical protein
LTLYDLPSNGKKIAMHIEPNNPLFDISTVPLGYVQVNPDVVAYVSRKPNRVYKQGINMDALNYKFISNQNRYNFSFVSKEFEDMILGKYLPLDEALRQLRQSTVDKEVAIDRNIALKITVSLRVIDVYFKGEVAGWIVPDTNVVIIPSTELAWVVSKHFEGFSWEVR